MRYHDFVCRFRYRVILHFNQKSIRARSPNAECRKSTRVIAADSFRLPPPCPHDNPVKGFEHGNGTFKAFYRVGLIEQTYLAVFSRVSEKIQDAWNRPRGMLSLLHPLSPRPFALRHDEAPKGRVGFNFTANYVSERHGSFAGKPQLRSDPDTNSTSRNVLPKYVPQKSEGSCGGK